MKKNQKIVLVTAPMSAGKSSIINALVGQELLHSANEATTAKITRIHLGSFSGARAIAHRHDKQIEVAKNKLCPIQLQKWNQDEKIVEIDIQLSTNAHNVKLKNVTIIDTPGANNSVNAEHGNVFIQSLKSYPSSTLLYVLNATQLGTNDDVEILKNIKEHHPAKKIIFVLSKVDLLDEELGETVKKYVANAKCYLNSLGFHQPVIIPAMALAGLAGKKKISNESLARKERNALLDEMEQFRRNPQRLSRAALLPYRQKRNWLRRMQALENSKSTLLDSNKELKAFTDYCGLQTLNTLISNTY